MKIYYQAVGILILLSVISCQQKADIDIPSEMQHTSLSSNRLAAEWEPAIGVMFAWPLHLPHKLVIELTRDTRAFVLCPSPEEVKTAKEWFTKWDIDLNKTQFLILPQDVDASWVRDWGPHAIFQSTQGLHLGDGEYKYSTPVTGIDCNDQLRFIFTDENGNIQLTTTEDEAPGYISDQLDIPLLELPFTFTGGNVLTDGNRTVFSTCVISNENEYDGMTQTDFLNAAQELAGARNYHLISNFEHRGIQHIDCFMKVLNEHTLLVARAPNDHELYPIYEKIVEEELSKLTNIYGDRYKILRLDTDRFDGEELAAYTNSLILNQHIYVPLFGIPQDSVALRQWSQAMPGYDVKGFEFVIKNEPVLADLAYKLYDDLGWRGGDALHCRTRAVWDSNMVFINVRPIHSTMKIYASIIDYSGKGLAFEPKLVWRTQGTAEWNYQPMQNVGETYYSAELPKQLTDTIEYYVSAISKSGKEENNPRTAPNQFHQMNVH